MNRLFKFAGILTCAVALGLNIQWAVDGYGIKDGKVHVEILAQTTGGTGTGSGSGSGTTWWNSLVYDCETEVCTFTFTIGIIGYTTYGKVEKCVTGSNVAHCWNCKGCDAPLY